MKTLREIDSLDNPLWNLRTLFWITTKERKNDDEYKEECPKCNIGIIEPFKDNFCFVCGSKIRKHNTERLGFNDDYMQS